MTKIIKDNKEEETNDESTKNLLGSLLKGYEDDHFNFIKNERLPISTGSLLLDKYVNIRTGSVVRFAGPLESGKTSECLLIMKNYLETIPKSRALYVKGEGRLSEEMMMRSGLKFVFSEDVWNFGTVFVLESNIFESVCDIIQSLLKNMYEQGEKLVFTIDSLDSMILKSDYEKKAGENVMPAGVPKMTKMFFRRLALPINKYDSLALLTSQYSENFKIDMYAKDKPQPVQGVGGSSVSHQPDWILEYGVRYTSHYILEDENSRPDPIKNKNLGHIVTVTLRKTTNEKTGIPVKIPIKYGSKTGNSIWREKECVDVAIGWSLIKRSGAWFNFSDIIIEQAKEFGIELKEKIQGLNGVYNYFEENKNICDWFYSKLKNIDES